MSTFCKSPTKVEGLLPFRRSILLAPIQNFIIGCAWPAMVTQFLTGRMYDITEREKEDLMNRASQISERQTSGIIDLNGIKSKLEEMEN